MYTQTFQCADGSLFVFSESENASKDGFWHVITHFGKFGLETEFTEYHLDCDAPVSNWIVRHRASRLPATVHLHAMHEHVLATHQMLCRRKPMPYLVHVAWSVFDQIRIVLNGAVKPRIRRFLGAASL
jgi:hypothetical protein